EEAAPVVFVQNVSGRPLELIARGDGIAGLIGRVWRGRDTEREHRGEARADAKGRGPRQGESRRRPPARPELAGARGEEGGRRERDRVAPREDRLASEDRDESKTERVPAVQIRPDQKKWRSGH